MSEAAEQIFLSDEILTLMRHAAELAGTVNEPFITVRSMLIALLDDPRIGPALHDVLPREKLYEYQMAAEAAKTNIASRVAEPQMQAGERAAMLRFNTLAFKVPSGSKSVWLSRDAFSAWNEGAKRVRDGERYMPKHLAFGIAADAVRAPGILAALHLSPGEINEAILKLE
ncbi:MAG: hypothetical protein JO322_13790 [Candidatus Eremiobacteraeota bacterium]|nr:hypothetical protein [Candidatus Eremiobacteraeota bacterium]